MEEDNGLELSLGLSCGGSSGKSKARDASLDSRAEESSGRNTNDADASFKNFLQTTIKGQNQNEMEHTMLRPPANFWTNLGSTSNATPCNVSQFPVQRDWASDGKTVEAEEEKSNSSKRKVPFGDVNVLKRRGVDLVDSVGKNPAAVSSVKSSRISATTEDGSCGENEEVAESEAEGSNSWSIPQREDNARNSDTSKFTDKHVIADGRPACLSSTHDIQPESVMSVPYPIPVKAAASTSISNAMGLSSPFFLPGGKNEETMIQGVNNNNVQLSFGYSQSQLPTLETGSSWAFGSPLQRVASSANRAYSSGILNSEHPGKAPAPEVQTTQWDFSKGKAEHEDMANKADGKPTESSNEAILTVFHPESSTIRPGVAPNIKFGGSGSYPELPWVTTTGTAPNGKTISGVTYKYSKDQIKIVCACHGLHMSPEGFIQHANAETTDQENNEVRTSLPAGKPAASAQS